MQEDTFLASFSCSLSSHPESKIRVCGLTFACPGPLPGPPSFPKQLLPFPPLFPYLHSFFFLAPSQNACCHSICLFSSTDLRPFVSPTRCAMPINLSMTTCSVLIGTACCHHCYSIGFLTLIQTHMQRTCTWNFEGLFSFVFQWNC